MPDFCYFIISGFVMWHTTYLTPPSPRVFLLRRIYRIAPLYWAGTIAFCALSLYSWTFSLPPSPVTGVTHLVTSLLLLPAGPPLVYWPILGLGWTLIYEMFFYAIFAATLYLVDWQVRFTAVSLILTALVAAGFLFQPQGWLRWYTAPVIAEFAVGVAIATWFAKGRSVLPHVAMLILTAGVAMLLLCPLPGRDLITNRVFYWGIPTALIVFGAVALEQSGVPLRSRWLNLLGDASYSLYITHIFVLGGLAIVWNKFHLWSAAQGRLSYYLLCVVVSILVGIGVYKFAERPLTRALRAKLKDK